jgi:hypothetical protein
VNASGPGLARIIGTEVAVIAIDSFWPGADSVIADIPGGASIPIIALNNVGSVLAASFGVTGVIGTRLVVVAVYAAGSRAETSITDITAGAGITIIAWDSIVGMFTSRDGIARIIGAKNTIIAIDSFWPGADTDIADISGSAGVPIVALKDVGSVLASCRRVARIIGTRLIVVAIYDPGSGTDSVVADITGGTGIIVIAWQ